MTFNFTPIRMRIIKEKKKPTKTKNKMNAGEYIEKGEYTQLKCKLIMILWETV